MQVPGFQKMLYSYDRPPGRERPFLSDHLVQLKIYYVWRGRFAEPCY